MNTTPSSSEPPDDETRNELEILFEEIDEIEKMLEPLNNAESESLRSQTEDKKKKLEAMDEGGLSPFRLSISRRDISRLKARAESMTISFLQDQIDEIEKILEPLRDADADALRSEKEHTKKKLESMDKWALPALQEEIRNIKERAQTLVTKSFLSGEIDSIERILGYIQVNRVNRVELKLLELEKEAKKNRLQFADDYELAALRKEIDDIKEKAVSLAMKRRLLPILPGVVWTTRITLSIVAIYIFCLGFVQSIKRPQILAIAIQTVEMQTASAFSNQNIQTVVPGATDLSLTPDPDSVTVSFSNQNNNGESVHLIIMQNDVELLNRIIPPGGIAPIENLLPGDYQVETRPIYASITPRSANCHIQWQQGDSYAGNLTITTGSQNVFSIRQFYLEPHEICFTETLTPTSP